MHDTKIRKYAVQTLKLEAETLDPKMYGVKLTCRPLRVELCSCPWQRKTARLIAAGSGSST